jgi:MFS superfamily sulfate permease-like transporter
MRETINLVKEKGVRMVLAEADDHIRHELDRSQVTELIGQAFIYESVDDVVAAYRAAVSGEQL